MCRRNRIVSCGNHALVLLGQYFNTWVSCGIFIENGKGFVGGTVVNADGLKIFEGLRKKTVKAFRDILFSIVSWYYYSHRWVLCALCAFVHVRVFHFSSLRVNLKPLSAVCVRRTARPFHKQRRVVHFSYRSLKERRR
jgi:hypothetical protein